MRKLQAITGGVVAAATDLTTRVQRSSTDSSLRSSGRSERSRSVAHNRRGSDKTEGSESSKWSIRKGSAKQNKLWFGADLGGQPMERDRGRRVPTLLAVLRRELEEQEGFEAEGIFRSCPDVARLQFVKSRLESGEDPETVCSGCSVEVIGALLKEWVRQLPGGLWAASSAEARDELEAALLGQTGPTGGQLALLLKHALGPGQREVLVWLLELLARAAESSAASKMGVDQLAVVFAPAVMGVDESAPPEKLLLHATRAVDMTRRLILGHAIAPEAPAVGGTAVASVKGAVKELGGAAAVATDAVAHQPLTGAAPTLKKRTSERVLADDARPVRRKSGAAGAAGSGTGLTRYASTMEVDFDEG